jgi:hypothetical protein
MTEADCKHEWGGIRNLTGTKAVQTCEKCLINRIMEVVIPQGMMACTACDGRGVQAVMIRGLDRTMKLTDLVCPECGGARFLEN